MSTHPATCKSPLAVAIATLLVPSLTHAAAEPALGEVVVTAARMQRPLEVVTDPKAPRQPLPAHDGADYLKTIPGFAVIRKGGTDGDPVFRGMAASRVNISVDGEQALGGCGMRMDPPTAYIYPETFDRVVVVKGPQTVLHGPGNSAATVIFERDRVRLATPGVDGEGSLLGGSFGRNDVVARLRLGNEQFQGELQGTRAEADDYEDGAGREVHSAYERWSGNGALAWTPDERTVVELTGALSDGEASYADRAMDGVKFARDNVGLKFERRELGEVLRKVEAQAYYNYVDHVMDNYSLRDFVPSAMMPAPAVSNPDRKTTGARAAVELALPRGAVATVGLDSQRNVHTLRSTMNQLTMPYELRARVEDARFEQLGAFGEFVVPAGGGRVVAGLRGDQWQARDQRETLRIGMSNVPNPTAKAQRDDTLWSGFARYERGQEDGPLTWYGGVGHVERFPDYWELVSAGKESLDSLSAFGTQGAPHRRRQRGCGHQRRRHAVVFRVRFLFACRRLHPDPERRTQGHAQRHRGAQHRRRDLGRRGRRELVDRAGLEGRRHARLRSGPEQQRRPAARAAGAARGARQPQLRAGRLLSRATLRARRSTPAGARGQGCWCPSASTTCSTATTPNT